MEEKKKKVTAKKTIRPKIKTKKEISEKMVVEGVNEQNEKPDVTPKKEHDKKLKNKNKLKKSEKTHSKNYRKAAELIDSGKSYPIIEAINLTKKTSTVKFDASLEVHIRLGVDPTKSEHQVRGSLVLPAGTGKIKKVLAIVGPDKNKEAKDAGADFVGGQELISKIEKGWLGFDVVVASPDMMPNLGKIGKILGTKGLMPNPKVGTVTQDIAKVVKNLKGGMIEYRADKNGIVHSVIGRVSFSDSDLEKNYNMLFDTLQKVKPNGVKGAYIKSVYLVSAMGPSVKVSISN